MEVSIVDRSEGVTSETCDFAVRRLLFALSRFDSKIDTVSLVITDVIGPRGGIARPRRWTRLPIDIGNSLSGHHFWLPVPMKKKHL